MRHAARVETVKPGPDSAMRSRPIGSAVAREIVGESAALSEVLRQVAQLRESDISVCVLGESGVGKELVARAIHASSSRRQEPFVAVNCAAVPENLQESELFGHERGAFTGALDAYGGRFEQARGGTLFLDEVGEMHRSTQAKLLRVLQERTYRRVGGSRDRALDARIVSSTNRDLEAEVCAGRFRADLFFRLVAYPLEVPPLRSRREDISLLVAHFLRRLCEETGRAHVSVTCDAMQRLVAYPWPGNVRELENVVHRALLSSRGGSIELLDLPAEVHSVVVAATSAAGVSASYELPTLTLRELETLAIEQALRRSGGNIERAARQLGIGRATIYRRLAGAGRGLGGGAGGHRAARP